MVFDLRAAGASLLGTLNPQPLTLASSRLIKGDGEVLEEIVTKEKHREINKVGRTPLAPGDPLLQLP